VAKIVHVALEVLRIVALTTGLVVALAAVTWAVIVITRWQLARREMLAADPARAVVTPLWGKPGQPDGQTAWLAVATSVLRAIGDGRYRASVAQCANQCGRRGDPDGEVLVCAESPQQPVCAGPGVCPGASQAAGTLFRFRTELALSPPSRGWRLGTGQGHHPPGRWSSSPLRQPWSRCCRGPAGFVRRAWCVLSRHRIQRVCFETRMHTRSGRLPWCCASTPRRWGNAADLVPRRDLRGRLRSPHRRDRAACYARHARWRGNKRWAQLVQLDVVRHDTLGTHHVIPSGLPDVSERARQAS
jgi:hypothetical protein